MPKGTARTSRAQRVAWLLAHQDLWVGYSHTIDNHVPKRPIIEAMRADGLYAPSTVWLDIDLDAIINLARQQRRNAAAGRV